jgi:putative transposase
LFDNKFLGRPDNPTASNLREATGQHRQQFSRVNAPAASAVFASQMGVRPSMEKVGDAYDNAMAESFFANWACEWIARRTWKTKSEALLGGFYLD